MAESKKFAPGSMVKIQTGGPAMTVMSTNNEDMCWCAWWNPYTNEVAYKNVPSLILELTNKADPYTILDKK